MRAKPYHPVVLDLIKRDEAKRVLDAPCGQGWLGEALKRPGQNTLKGPAEAEPVTLDGAGLYEFPAPDGGYRNVIAHDLNQALPAATKAYDAVVCAEAIHLLTCPGTLLESFRTALRPGGRVIITTPNSWSPGSRFRFLRRGFHSGFASAVDKTIGEDYVTYFPFSYDRLHLLLTHYGFEDIALHPVPEPKPVTLFHRALSFGSRRYCRKQAAQANSKAIRQYWEEAGSEAAQHGRWLVMSAKRPQDLSVEQHLPSAAPLRLAPCTLCPVPCAPSPKPCAP